MGVPGNVNPLLLVQAAAAGGYTIDRSLRFNSADSAYLNRTPASAGNRKTWTWAGWVKRSKLGAEQFLFNCRDTAFFRFVITSSDTFAIWDRDSGDVTQFQLITTQVFRDPSSWFHVVLSIDTTQSTSSNRAKLYINGVQVTTFSTATYPNLNHDLDFNRNVAHWIGWEGLGSPYYLDSYLADVHFIDGQALDPTSFGEFDATTGVWNPIAYTGSYGTNGFHLDFADNSSAAALGYDAAGSNDWTVNNISVEPTAYPVSAYRENTSATSQTWDSSSAASSTSSSLDEDEIYWADLGGSVTTNYVKVDVTVTGTDTNPANYFIYYSSSSASLGSATWTLPWAVAGGSTTGSFTLTLSGAAITGRYFGIVNGNGGTPATFVFSNLRVYNGNPKDNDSLRDSPTNGDTANDTGAGGEVPGNYCTLNPLTASSYISLSNGNLDSVGTTSADNGNARSTIGFTSGKWYIEFTCGSTASNAYSNNPRVGIIPAAQAGNPANGSTGSVGAGTNSCAYYRDGKKYIAGSESAYGSSWTTGDVIGIAIDADNGAIYFSKNGTYQNSGVPTSGASKTGAAFTWTGASIEYVFALSQYNGTAGSCNFGQRSWAYAAPAGFKALCTANLPEPTIEDPSTVMDVALYTGNGTSQSVTLPGTGFEPDFVWLKARNDGADHHHLFDTIRGAGKRIFSNLTNAESTDATTLTSFDSSGFSVGAQTAVNGSGDSMVGWCWDAGTSTASNTSGTITSSVRANASAGFSIVSYTVPTGLSTGTYISIGHGLNVLPGLIILKERNNVDDWLVIHKDYFSTQQYLYLNQTAAISGAGTAWGAGITSSVFGQRIGSLSGGGEDCIAYCFAPVEGYSAFGSYTGNGSTDGPFVYTGHRVRWILIKRTDSTGNWNIYDTQRNLYNTMNLQLVANASDAENTTTGGLVDTVSNGFKLRGTGNTTNASGATYIYAAFAENPFALNARAR